MRAISSMATRHVLADLARDAHAAGHPAVEIESVGGVDAERRVAGGEPFDLVFLARGALSRLADGGAVDPATVTALVASEVAVAVPAAEASAADAPAGVAYGDADEVREALRAAGRIGYSTGPSGTALVEKVQDWGLADQMSGRLIQARPGVPVAALLAGGEVDLGFQQLSELVGQPGIRILGTLPTDCAITTVFSGAVARAAGDPGAAREVLAWMASPSADAVKIAHHFAVPESSAGRS